MKIDPSNNKNKRIIKSKSKNKKSKNKNKSNKKRFKKNKNKALDSIHKANISI